MIAAIHQPNYLPYYGYFHKIKQCNVFVFLDSVLYTKSSYINRNRIKTPQKPHWLTVPVERSGILKTKIGKVRISNRTNWGAKHWKALKRNYGRTDFFGEYRDFFEDAYSRKWEFLSTLNEYLIKNIAAFLGIEANFVHSLELKAEGKKTDLMIAICKEIGADTYLSGLGAKTYLDESKFALNNINLEYQTFTHPTYRQRFGDFEANLSIVDLLFNEGRFI